MRNKSSAIRTPIRRQNAEEYLLETLLSFAVSVSVTRLFLYMTGYPQIGTGQIHIAHVLWGGLLLFIAALSPLILANRWVFPLSAILTGTGVGLFIDEVGKFITRSNDYFFPWAAPIIYGFFLLIVLLYVRIRRPYKENYRADLYYILEDLQEVLDHDLSENEKANIIDHLERVKKVSHSDDLVRLSAVLEEFITNRNISVVPDNNPQWKIILNRIEKFEGKWLNRNRYRAFLAGSLSALAIWSMYYPFYILTVIFSRPNLESVLLELLKNPMVQSSNGVNWYSTLLFLEISMGIVLLVSSVLITIGRDRRAIFLAYLGLLFSLTVVNILVFYFDQFSTIINSFLQFSVLMVVLHYRSRFLPPRPRSSGARIELPQK